MGNARGVNEGELNEVMDAADESGSHPFPSPSLIAHSSLGKCSFLRQSSKMAAFKKT